MAGVIWCCLGACGAASQAEETAGRGEPDPNRRTTPGACLPGGLEGRGRETPQPNCRTATCEPYPCGSGGGPDPNQRATPGACLPGGLEGRGGESLPLPEDMGVLRDPGQDGMGNWHTIDQSTAPSGGGRGVPDLDQGPTPGACRPGGPEEREGGPPPPPPDTDAARASRPPAVRRGRAGSSSSTFDCTLGFPGEGPGTEHSDGEVDGIRHLPRVILLEKCLKECEEPQAHDRRLVEQRLAARGRRDRNGFSVYYANVTAWSEKAQSYAEHEVQCDALAFVETHLPEKEYMTWKGRMTKRWGLRVSGRAAVPTLRSELGTSGGCLMAVSKALASYSLGPLDGMEGFCRPLAKFWCGRSVRLVGRDLLLLTVYLPPGERYMQIRQDTMQDLALLVQHCRGCWAIIGDWNTSPEDLSASGFVTFLQGTIVTAGAGATCRQGRGTVIG